MLTAKEIENIILGEDGVIDSRLMDLQYSLLKHTVRMEFHDEEFPRIIFKDCFNVDINIWLEGSEGYIPQVPGDSDFYLHDAEIKEVTIEGVQLLDCTLTIPMMDCRFVCKSVEFEKRD